MLVMAGPLSTRLAVRKADAAIGRWVMVPDRHERMRATGRSTVRARRAPATR